MQLIIDVGNTRVKAAVFDNTHLEELVYIDRNDFIAQIGIFAGKYPVTKAIISSVGRLSEKQRRSVQLRFPTILLTHETKVPFINMYKTPETLGVDRIGLMAAFAKAYPQTSGLVIDVGSCITYDYLDEKARYWGGAIAPGIRLRYEAMHNYTANLPLLSGVQEQELVGNTTESAMFSGVINGVLAEIDGVISRYKEEFQVQTVVITGGDGEFLSKRLKNSIFALSNFLLEGLNYILINSND